MEDLMIFGGMMNINGVRLVEYLKDTLLTVFKQLAN